MEKILKEKQCPSCEDTLPIHSFERLDYKKDLRIHKNCNDCADYERIMAEYERSKQESLIKSLIPKKIEPKVRWRLVEERFSIP